MRKKNVFIFANAKVSQFASENVSNRLYKAVLSTFDTMRKLSQFCRIILRNTRAAKRIDAQPTFSSHRKKGNIMATADTHSTARLEDVAALANVSLATASKALHGKPRVSEDTRERVMEAARQLNYSPNKLAQSLASGRSGTIGLVTSDLQGRFPRLFLLAPKTSCAHNRHRYYSPMLAVTMRWNAAM